MKLWLDAQLSPRLCAWLHSEWGLDAVHVRDLGLREADDEAIFQRARSVGIVVLTKDEDFVHLVNAAGPPPQVVWLTCGNMSNARLRQLLKRTLPPALALIEQGEELVEIGQTQPPRSRPQRRGRPDHGTQGA